MPTSKPRVMVIVDPAIAADLERIARFRGQPVSRVVADSLQQLAPVFRQTVTAIEFVELADGKAAELAAKYTGEFQRRLAPAVEAVEKATREAEGVVARIEAGRAARKAPGAAARPSFGIKGAGFPKRR